VADALRTKTNNYEYFKYSEFTETFLVHPSYDIKEAWPKKMIAVLMITESVKCSNLAQIPNNVVFQ
jgi:hypothetical protein